MNQSSDLDVHVQRLKKYNYLKQGKIIRSMWKKANTYNRRGYAITHKICGANISHRHLTRELPMQTFDRVSTGQELASFKQPP
jgi:hypothetical protein